MEIVLHKDPAHRDKKVKVGWSWTYFLFGSIVGLFRLDWLGLLFFGGIQLLCLALDLTFFSDIQAYCDLIFDVFLAFFANNWYIRRLLKKGWKPVDEEAAEILNENKLKNAGN